MKLPFIAKTNDRKTAWDKWPKWDDENSFRTPRLNFSCSVSDYSCKTGLDNITLLKDRQMLETFRNFGIDAPIAPISDLSIHRPMK
jgi:hypothetical protein